MSSRESEVLSLSLTHGALGFEAFVLELYLKDFGDI